MTGRALLALAALAAAPLAARAQSTCAALSVGLEPAHDRAAAQLGVVLEAALRHSARHVFVDLADAADPSGAAQRFSLAQDAAEALAKAREAYDGFEFDGAADHARRAAALASNGPLADRREALTRALLTAAAGRYYAGDEPGAREEFARLQAVDAGAWLDPGAWSPELVAVALDERFRLQALRKGEARVRTGPVAARVFLDGAFAGVAPLTLRGLTPGPHRITAQAPFFAQRDASVEAGGMLELRLEPTPAGPALAAQARRLGQRLGEREGDAAARELAAAVGAQQLLVARVESRGSTLFARVLRISAADGRQLGEASGPIAFDSTAGFDAAALLARSALAGE